MTNPYPPPRRLTRSVRDRYVGGVCGGVAHYLNIDATLVRLSAVALTVLTGGAPILIYIVALFLLPDGDQGDPPPRPRPPLRPPSAAPGPAPRAPYAGPRDPIWGTEGAPWEQPEPQPQRPPAEPGSGPTQDRS